MNRKSGISMMVLVVGIIVSLILLSTIALEIENSSGSEKISVFVNNITVIEDYIKSCNILKEELPLGDSITMQQAKSLVNIEHLQFFSQELAANGDSGISSFKKVDLNNAGIKKQFTGYGNEGPNDIYIYSENSGRVYYLYGLEYKDKVYFSVNNEITNIAN